MGRHTWESLPERFRPLPGRRNVVLTRSPGWSAPGAETATSLEAALAPGTDVWVIGGGEVYRAALPRADVVVRTEIDLVVDGDVVAPVLDGRWEPAGRDPETGWNVSRAGLRFRVARFRLAPSSL